MKISAIAHATENPEKVVQAIRNLCPEEASVRPTINRAKGHHGNEIVALVFTIRNTKVAKSFLQNIWNSLSQLDRTEVYSSLTSRIDSTGTLFMRVDKQEALKGRIRLQNIDPVKIGISFRTKPSRQDGFVNDIRRRLEEIRGPD